MEVREDMDFTSLPFKGETVTSEDLYEDYEGEAEVTEEFEVEMDFDELLLNEEEVEEEDEEF
jgi:hypothetical protein